MKECIVLAGPIVAIIEQQCPNPPFCRCMPKDGLGEHTGVQLRGGEGKGASHSWNCDTIRTLMYIGSAGSKCSRSDKWWVLRQTRVEDVVFRLKTG